MFTRSVARFVPHVVGLMLVGVPGTAALGQPFSELPAAPKPDIRTPDAPRARDPKTDVAPLETPKADAPAANVRPTDAGYLGLATDNPRDNANGLRVVEAVADSPAAKAGFKIGDRVVRVNGKTIRGTADMAAVLNTLPPGGQATFDVDRDGVSRQIAVVLGKRPQRAERTDRIDHREPTDRRIDASSPPSGEPLPEPLGPTPGGPASQTGPAAPTANESTPRHALLGVRTQPVSEEVRRRLQMSSTKGALVVGRTVGSPADLAGIPLDSVIVSFNRGAVDSPQDLAKLVSQLGPHKSAEMIYISDGESHRTNVSLKELAAEATPAVPTPTDDTPPSAATPAPVDPIHPAVDRNTRIEALEQHIHELEQRVRDLEANRKQ